MNILLPITSLQPSNAGHRGTETGWGYKTWKRNSNINPANSRTAAASGALAPMLLWKIRNTSKKMKTGNGEQTKY